MTLETLEIMRDNARIQLGEYPTHVVMPLDTFWSLAPYRGDARVGLLVDCKVVIGKGEDIWFYRV